MQRIIGIIRVSTDGQAGEKGEGLDRQRAALRSIEKAHPGSKWFPDVEIRGVSGSDLSETSEWKLKVLPALRAGASVAADSLDRIVRMGSDFNLSVLADIRKHGGKILTPGRVMDPTDSRDVLMLGIQSSIGGYEKAEIKRRAWAGKEEKRKRGEWVGPLKLTPRGTRYDRERKRWTYDPLQADQVRRAFEKFRDGYSMKSIAESFTPPMTPPGVRVLLANHIYRGVFRITHKRGAEYDKKDGRQPGRRKVARPPEEIHEVRVYGDAAKGQEPQLVPDDLFTAVQSRLAAMKGEGRQRREKAAPLTYYSGYLYPVYQCIPTDDPEALDPKGLLQHVVYGDATVNRVTRYSCRCRRDLNTDPNAPRPRCDLHYLPAEWVNKGVDRFLREITLEGWGVDEVRKQLERREDDSASYKQTEKRIKKALVDLDRQRDRILDLFVSGDITEEKKTARLKANSEQQDTLRRDLALLDKPADVDVKAVQREWIFDVEWQPDVKRRWVSRWAKAILVSNEGVAGVVLRMPGEDGTTVLFNVGLGKSWQDLTGAVIQSTESRMAAEGRYTAGEVLGRLSSEFPQGGWEANQRGLLRLNYLVRSGQVPKPLGCWGLKKIWTEEELKRLKATIKKKGLRGV